MAAESSHLQQRLENVWYKIPGTTQGSASEKQPFPHPKSKDNLLKAEEAERESLQQAMSRAQDSDKARSK